MGKITKKEVNAKKDYVVMNLYHERYSCDFDIAIFRNTSIVEIYKHYNYCDEFDITKLERQGFQEMGYVYDKCGPYEPNDYELTKRECKRFRGYHIEALAIVELDKFMKEEDFGTVIMDTQNKWGLLDYSCKPVDMHLNKNKLEKISNKLYEKYKWYKKFIEFTWEIKSIPFKIRKIFRKQR